MSLSASRGAFVLGTGRTGSTLLSSILQEHPTILSISEFISVMGWENAWHPARLDGEAFWRKLTVNDPAFAAMIEFGLDIPELLTTRDEGPLMLVPLPHLVDDPERLLGELEPVIRARGEASLRDHYDFLFEWLCVRCGRRRWVERSGLSLPFARTLLSWWPHAHIIHSVRDGRECAISMSRHHIFRLAVARDRGLLPPTIDFATLQRYASLELPLVYFGELWSGFVKIATEELERVPAERRLEVRYESICAEPEAEIRRLCRFLDPDFDDEPWIAAAADIVGEPHRHFEALPVDDQRALERACQPGLEQLGYPLAF